MRWLGPPVQIAYAVPDARVAAQRWHSEAGAGPFFVRSTTDLEDVRHRGAPSAFDHTSAYGQWGSVMLELVEDHQRDSTPIREMFAPGESGLHHMAFLVPSFSFAVERSVAHGYAVAMTARTPGGTEFCFVDARSTHGHMFELYESSERLRGFYEQVRLASLNSASEGPFVRT